MLIRWVFSRARCGVGARLCAISFFLVVSAVASAQDVARTFRKGPYLQSPGSDTMTIMWESPTNRPGVVRYGRKGKLDEAYRLERPRELIGVSSYAVTNTTADGKARAAQESVTNTG